MHAPGMRAAIVFLLQLFFRRHHLLPARFSFFSLVLLFFSLAFAWPNRERELAWGTRLLSDREAIDRASARWLPPKGRPNVRTWRDRTSIFHRARLRITCPCAPHANRPFASLPFPLSFNELYVWRLENYIPHDVWILRSIYSFSRWSEPTVGEIETKKSLLWFIIVNTIKEHLRFMSFRMMKP